MRARIVLVIASGIGAQAGISASARSRLLPPPIVYTVFAAKRREWGDEAESARTHRKPFAKPSGALAGGRSNGRRRKAARLRPAAAGRRPLPYGAHASELTTVAAPEA
jgi:hypothetical protein